MKKKKKKKKKIITNSVDPHELLPGVSHLANPGICNTTTTTRVPGSPQGHGIEGLWAFDN